jgi:serine/threonine protein kinase/Flp pilus assembly protein TadD
MDHPNIAKVLDAGTTASGRPYFVMELVKGVPITKYCDDHHLTPSERLELFVPVCQAVQHAHQKGIIHRDLKPSNVLVCVYDGKAVPKVIDFGVAKATGPKLTDRTLYTEFGAIVGTVEYMSPEQAVLDQLDVDTRSDIYSLGVLLYELLTGTTPLDRKRLKQVAVLELLRLVREEDAPRPSTRLSTLEALPTIAANRGIEPRRLSALLNGELDWVVLKALEKDRNRRYETPNGLARDIERYLNDEPVQACPPSAVYRIRKFARRHRAALAAVAGILLAVLLGVAGLAASTLLIYQEQKRTKAALAREALQHKRAEAHFHDARDAVDQMLTEVGQEQLAQFPHLDQVRRALLEKALKFYDKFLQQKSNDPSVRLENGRAHRRVGDIQARVGQPRKAEVAYDDAIRVLDGLASQYPKVPAYRQELARSHSSRGALLRQSARLQPAEVSLRRAVALLGALVEEDPSEPSYRVDLARSNNNLAIALNSLGRHEEAEKSYREAVRRDEQLAADFPTRSEYRKDLAKYASNLAGLLGEMGRLPEAERFAREAVEVAEAVSGELPADREFQMVVAGNHASLGFVLFNTRRPDEAEKEDRRALDVHAKLVADFPDVPEYRMQLAISHNTLGVVQWQTGRLKDAEESLERSRVILETLCDGFPAVPIYHSHLGNTLLNLTNLITIGNGIPGEAERARLPEGRQLIEEGIRHSETAVKLNPNNVLFREQLIRHRGALAGLLSNLKAPDAESAHRKAIELEKELVAEFPYRVEYQSNLGGSLHNFALMLEAQGKLEKARRLLEEAIALQQTAYKANPRLRQPLQYLRNHYGNLADILTKLQAPAAEIDQAYRELIELNKRMAADAPEAVVLQVEVGNASFNFAKTLYDRGELEPARPLLEEAIQYHQRALRSAPRSRAYRQYLANDNVLLGEVLRQRKGSPELTEKAMREAVRFRSELAEEAAQDAEAQKLLGSAQNDLATFVMEHGKPAEAEQLLGEAVRHQKAALSANARDTQARLYLFNHYVNLAEALARRGKYADAAKVTTEIPGVSPDDWMGYYKAIAPWNLLAALAVQDAKLPDAERDELVQTSRERAASMLGEAARRIPADPTALNDMAWMLATWPDPKFRDPVQAVGLAQKAVELAPSNGNVWNTLGVAYLRSGNWKAASDALNKSMALRNGGDGGDWFLQSIARWQLGDKSDARKWYDRAVDWMEQHDPQNPDLAQFRKDAEGLLEIKKNR